MTRLEPTFDDMKMLIGGELVDSSSGETFESINPATGEFLAAIPRGMSEDVDRAVEAAERGFETWREWSVRDRAERLEEIAELFESNAEHLGTIDAASSGNPVAQMKRDAVAAAERIKFFADIGLEIKGETIPVSNDTLNYTLEQPYGVVGRILAYNHPLLFTAKLASALIVGNAVVIKPPEQDSESVLEAGRMIAEREILPPGVLNIVSGFGDEVGEPLVTHPSVEKVGFTGSRPTGKVIQRQAADTVTDVLLELGGKNPCIVYPDADVEDAVSGAITGMNFTWCGQSCGSTSRLFLHESCYDEGVELLRDQLESVQPGDPLDMETEMGAIVSEAQYEKIRSYIQAGLDDGAMLLLGGGHPEGAEYKDGYFIEPTVFTDVTMDMRIANEEIFGPVLSVLEWDDENAMIAEANDVPYGLTASIWTDDVTTAHRTAAAIEAGHVWINEAGPHYLGAPFGGWKESGTGREGGIQEALEFTQTKNVTVRL